MKPSNEQDILLSKSNARTLLFRNAHDAASLKIEERLLQREWNSEEKLFLKQRDQMLQRRSNLAGELSPRPRRKAENNTKGNLLSVSTSSLPEQLSPPRSRVMIARSKTFSDADCQSVTSDAVKPFLSPSSLSLTEPLSRPRSLVLRSKTFSGADVRPSSSRSMTLSALPLSSLTRQDQQPSPPRSPQPRRKILADSVRTLSDDSLKVSLPDINISTVKTTGKKLKETKLKWMGRKYKSEEKEDTCPIDDWEDIRKCRYLRTYAAEK